MRCKGVIAEKLLKKLQVFCSSGRELERRSEGVRNSHAGPEVCWGKA